LYQKIPKSRKIGHDNITRDLGDLMGIAEVGSYYGSRSFILNLDKNDIICYNKARKVFCSRFLTKSQKRVE